MKNPGDLRAAPLVERTTTNTVALTRRAIEPGHGCPPDRGQQVVIPTADGPARALQAHDPD